MKHLLIVSLIFSSLVVFGQKKVTSKSKSVNQVVEASCGQCQFKMAGKGCNLAVRIDGKPYFVDGTGIDDHGDAHGDAGFCNKIRKAEVKGKIVKGRFEAQSFKLLD